MAPPIRRTSARLRSLESRRLPPHLTDDALREIFLRVASPADLVRASAACVSFCGLIADPSFLRQYRSRHQPLLLGFIDFDGPHPVQKPHPNAAAARAFARTVDFSFGYLPREGRIVDVRDGRILVQLIPEKGKLFLECDHAVCDPVSRRYQLVRPVPDELLASAQIQELSYVEYFLAPSEEAGGTSFSLMCCTHVKTGLVLFVFSSRCGHWSVATATTWDALGLRLLAFLRRCYVYGWFYWKVIHENKLLKLDMGAMEFSTHDLPPDHAERKVVFLEAGDGKLAMFSHMDKGASLDYYNFLPNDSKKGGEWHMKNTVLFPSDYKCEMLHRHHSGGDIYLYGTPRTEAILSPGYFTLDTNTFEIGRLTGIDYPAIHFPYSGLPPIISPRSIQEC